MKIYESDLWGEVEAPETFIELISLITHNTKPGINVSYWRGQADIAWPLEPSIVRKIKLDGNNKNKSGKELDRSIQFWEERLLTKAKKNLYNYDVHGRELGDIELLAKLQHCGAATRLLDFTKNVLVALWFCASDDRKKNDIGLLIGIDTDVIAGMEDEFIFEKNHAEFFSGVCQSNKIWMVDSPANISRISAQHSVFLCSKSAIENYGTLLLPESKTRRRIIAISPELKIESLRILSECFNITYLTMFPDFEGFAEAHSSKWENSKFTRW